MVAPDQKNPFWEAVSAAHEHAMSGNKDKAIDALLAAHRSMVGGKEFFEQRKALLQTLRQAIAPDQESLLDEKSFADPVSQRILVSGIGRSGTTLIYQQVAKLLLLANLNVNFRYEPYLWNICTPEAKGNPFGMSQLHQRAGCGNLNSRDKWIFRATAA